MDLNLSGKHALVCGASQGIGRAAAMELAHLGASITLLARSRETLEATLAELPKSGAQTHAFIAVDMNDHEALRTKVEAATHSKPVQILINNTGGPPAGPAHTAKLDDFRIAFNQHLIAAQIVVQAVLPGMRGSGYGRIVNVISTSVKEPLANLGVSNTVRAAMASWAKTLSGELAAAGITVNNVLPGYTKTQRLSSLIAGTAKSAGKSEDDIARGMLSGVPAGRFGEANEIAAMIAFLCTPAAAYVNGVSIAVDGGRTRSLS
jgi:3-oxoacyl-[acyl-carrier protein] reductase